MTSPRLARPSLKAKITLSTLAIFVASIWSLVFFASHKLRDDLEILLGAQELSIVSIFAAEANKELLDRLTWLETVAKNISPSILDSPSALQQFLDQRLILPRLFNGGGIIHAADGTAIADSLPAAGRIGRNFLESDSVSTALKEGKANIGAPVKAQTGQTGEFSISVPIRDEEGKVIGAFTGFTHLGRANFFDKIQQGKIGETGGFLLVAPKNRLVVIASDKSRTMETLPPVGAIPALDRFIDGHEGSAVFVNPKGVEVLASVRKIPATGWYLSAILPTQEAFAPIREMQHRMLIAALLCSVLACGLTWWMLRRQLSPMVETASTLSRLATEANDPNPLPVVRQDEIGEMITGFNRLLESIGHRDAQLKESEARLRLALEAARQDWFVANVQTGEAKVGNEHLRLIGYEPGEFNTSVQGWLESIHPEDAPKVAPLFKQLLESGGPVSLEYRRRTKSGDWVWLQSIGKVIEWDSNGKALRLTGIHQDIADRKQAEARLAESERRFRDIAVISADWIWEVDSSGRYTYVSEGVRSLLGYSPEEILGKLPFELMAPDEAARVAPLFGDIVRSSAPFHDLENTVLDASGQSHITLTSGVPIFDSSGTCIGYRGVDRDITERKGLEAELLRQARADYLTGISNRRDFMERADEECRRASRYDQVFSVAMLDVDNFKKINDVYGHKVGDAVLKVLAGVCRENLREIDIFGRIGGEEFAVLMPETDRESALHATERLRSVLADAKVPLDADGASVRFTVSIGVVTRRSADDRLESLLDLSDKALYQAKRTGKNKVVRAEDLTEAQVP